MIEQVQWTQFHSEGVGDTDEDACRLQRIATELEERVVDADLGERQNVAPDTGDLRFRGRARRDVGGVNLGSKQRRRWQFVSVDLAVGQRRQLVHPHEGRRNHVIGQTRGERAAQRADRAFAAVSRNDKGHEHLLAVLPRPRFDHRRPDRIQTLEGELNLRQLDAEAPNLDERVAAAHVHHRSVWQPHAEIAGPVEASAAVRVSWRMLPP